MDRPIYPRLWQNDKNSNGKQKPLKTNIPNEKMPSRISPETYQSFEWSRSDTGMSIASSPYSHQPPPTTLWTMVCRTLVISQEVSLSVMFLAGHRCILCNSSTKEEDNMMGTRSCVHVHPGNTMMSMQIISYTLFFTLYRILFSKDYEERRAKQESSSKGEKLRTRLVDALLIAGILRFLSSVLSTLTASYSSDTVTALAVGGVIFHILTCDYRYANGIQDESSMEKSAINVDLPPVNKRPIFAGGTFSINCIFFSATLLASRLPSNTTAYIFLMGTVTFFGTYPTARHNLSTVSSNSATPTLIISVAVLISTLLLIRGKEIYFFILCQLSILCIAPLWKWRLQRYKQIISGPWDIAHICTN